MCLFNNAVCLGVVWGDPDVIDLVAFCKVVEGLDEGWAIEIYKCLGPYIP